MSTINVNQLLGQLRSLAAQADGGLQGLSGIPRTDPSGATTKTTSGFGELLTHALDEVNGSQMQANKAANAFATGQGDLPTAMLAASRAQVQFRATVEVRNRLVQAYREIMQMTV